MSNLFTSFRTVSFQRIVWFSSQDHCRWIFKTPYNIFPSKSGSFFYKIWNSTYIRRDNILRSLDAGFYDEHSAPALHGLIFHKGICRGYVMHHCKPATDFDADFFDLIKRKTLSTGYFHLEYHRYHVMTFDNLNTLIDLEGAYHILDLDKVALHHSEFFHAGYEQFVRSLAHSSRLNSTAVRYSPIEPDRDFNDQWNLGFFSQKAFIPLRILNRKIREIGRLLRNKLANRSDLIEK